MRSAILSITSLLMLAGFATAASAHGVQRPCNPYNIVKNCDADGGDCKIRMRYAPGHSLDASPRGNYFYSKPHRWLYHEAFGHKHVVRYVETSYGVRQKTKYKRVCVPHHHLR